MIAGFIPPTAICRHTDQEIRQGAHDHRYESSSTPKNDPFKPDADNFEVEDVVQVGKHLVMKVRYPNCAACAYEGNKVMVFLDTTPLQAMKWRKIDPHFRKSIGVNPKAAPSPAARFPASAEGWADALAYARCKDQPPTFTR